MCDACCVDSCIRVRRSIEFLHGDCREPVCARQASWYLVVQVHNAPAEKRGKKKKKITEVQEAEGIFHSSVMFEPLRECISFLNQPAHTVFLTLQPFDQPVVTLTVQYQNF